MAEDNEREKLVAGLTETEEEYGNRHVFRSTYYIVAAILGAFAALVAFGDDLPGAVQTLLQSGRLRPQCVFDPAEENEALIIILPFYQAASGSSEAHYLIHEAVEDKIEGLGLENIRAEINSNAILELSERNVAQEHGDICNAAVVIWGMETEAYVQVNFLNIKEPQAYTSFGRVRVMAPKDFITTKIIVDHLPRLIASLSLFAVGQAFAAEGAFTTAIRVMEEVTESIDEELISEELDSDDTASAAYNWLGWLYYNPPTQDYQKALNAYRKSLALDSNNSNALGNMGNLHSALGEYEISKGLFEQALAISREGSDREGEETWSGNLGIVYKNLGQYETAKNYYEPALTIAQEIGDREGEAIWFSNLGVLYRRWGQYETAKDYLEQALAISREIGDRQGEGYTLGNLGNVYRNMGLHELAWQHHQQALAISREIGDRDLEATELGALGNVSGSLEQYEAARGFYEQSLAIYREIGDRGGEGNWLGNLGSVHRNLGEYETAKDYYEQALSIAREIGDRAGEGYWLGSLGNVYGHLGEYEAAMDYLEQGISILEEINSPDAEIFRQIVDENLKGAGEG